MGRYKIIVNPTSGRGNGLKRIPELERCLLQKQIEFDLVTTKRPLHATELAQEAVQDRYDVVVAAGGDGTVNEVINGLMLSKENGAANQVSLGVLPVGRGNDFAFGIGIPDDLAAGCQIIANGHRKMIDVGRVTGGLFPGGRYFGNSVGIGFDAVVGFEAAKMTRLNGFVSYLAAALKTIFLYYHAPLVQIAFEDQAILQPSIMVSVMNGPRQGGVFFMSPNAQNDDGLLDLCIAEEISRFRIFTLIPHFFKGSQFGQAEIQFGQTGKVVITAVQGVLPAHADGETICKTGQELAIELLPCQLEVIGPGAENYS